MNKSIIAQFFKEHASYQRLVTFVPNGKPPLKFYGVPIHSATISGGSIPADYFYELFALESGKCVLLYIELDYADSSDGVPVEFRRAKVIETDEDMWSFASKSLEIKRLSTFAGWCGETLGNESFFFKLIK